MRQFLAFPIRHRAVRIILLLVVFVGANAFLEVEPHIVAASPSSAQDLKACSAIDELRQLQTAVPVTPTATSANAPTPTPRPPTATPLPAPQQDRVGFPENYQADYKLLFVLDRPDNRQVRLICGNDKAASVKPGEPFPYGSILVMITYRTKQEGGKPILDADSHYIRENIAGIFVMRKEN
jgi:hypothetical protein